MTDPGVAAAGLVDRVLERLDLLERQHGRLGDLLARAEGEAARDRGALVSPLHLLIATSQETTGGVASVFRAMALTGPIVRALATGTDLTTPAPTNGSSSMSKPGKTDLLADFGRDLVQLAKEGLEKRMEVLFPDEAVRESKRAEYYARLEFETVPIEVQRLQGQLKAFPH